MFKRPRIARKDKNQTSLLRELGQMMGGWSKVDLPGLTQSAWTGFCRGVPVVVIDTSGVGGLLCDTQCVIDGKHVLYVEIKDAGKREELTAGESLMQQLAPAAFYIVENSDEYYRVVSEKVKVECE